jgi:hypothetical protein
MVGVYLGVQITSLLCDGNSIQQTAKALNCSVSLVWKHARRSVVKGTLERISKYPAQFRKPQPIYTPPHLLGNIHPISPPIDIPCKFGASFAQVGKPPLIYGANGKVKDIQATHIAIFGKDKTVIWLKAGFRGETPDEIIKNGNETLKSIARGYAQQYGISLAYLNTFLDIEWIMVNLTNGKRISKHEGIKNGERKLIASAWHKQGDSSHPLNRQYQAVKGNNPIIPKEHASIDDYLYSGKFARDMVDLKEIAKEMTGEYSKNIKLHLEAIRELRDAARRLNK